MHADYKSFARTHFTKLLFVFALRQINSVSGGQQVSSALPYCNQLFNGRNTQCDLEKIPGSSLHMVSCVLSHDETSVWSACEIDSRHSLHLKFERVSEVFDIFLSNSTYVTRYTNVSSTMGKASCQFRHSSVISVRDAIVSGQQMAFSKFSCNHSPTGFIANAIVISSIVPRIVNLFRSRQPSRLSLDSILLRVDAEDDGAQTGSQVSASIHDTGGTFGSDMNVVMRRADNVPPAAGRIVIFSSGSQENGKHPENCPPIDPYRGMPEEYKDYQLVVNGLINSALQTKPCGDGYKFMGNLSDINQCRDGSWQGSAGFPVCQAIRTKTPPNVKYAAWTFIHPGVYHEIKYACYEGYTLIGNSVARYNIDRDEWINVPECQRIIDTPTHHSMQNDHLLLTITISIVGGIVVLGVAIAFALLLKKLRRGSIQQAPPPLSTDVNRALENGYTALRNASEGEFTADG